MDGSRGEKALLDGVTGTNIMNRAEKFEDEKRRIINSCFSKKGADGSLQESYITHIPIVEDAAYPSSPPPPNSNLELKKPRVIVVAVKKSGHVRMHKARENVNSTFSIGKTWPLDDLSSIESFSGMTPANSEEEQRKQWAGVHGFIVTIGKPYYWQANTQKEKQFFIASLVKIYTKYTGGNSPQLTGFDEKERDQLLNQGRPQPPFSQSPAATQSSPSTNPPFSQAQAKNSQQTNPQESFPRQPISQDTPLRPRAQSRPSGGIQSSTTQNLRPTVQPKREESPSSSIDYSGVTPQQSQSNLRRLAGANQSQDSFGRGDDISSLAPRSRGGLNGLPSAPGRFPDRSATPTSQRAVTPDSSVESGSIGSNNIPPLPAPLSLPPERRRPPMPLSSEGLRPGKLDSNDDLIPAPLSSPSIRRDDLRRMVVPDERPEMPIVEKTYDVSKKPANDSVSSLETSKKLEKSQSASGSANGLGARPGLGYGRNNAEIAKPVLDDDRDNLSVPVPAEAPKSAPTDTPAIVPDDERPGLGPMIKKRTRAEIASTFRKAATTVNAFKPRAGGAAERLREQQIKQSEGPDGITGVVPAPSLLRAASNDSAITGPKDSTDKERPSTPKASESIPEVKITVPLSSRPNSLQTPADNTPKNSNSEKIKGKDAPRRKPTSEATQRHLACLGVDPNILDENEIDFPNLLDDIGWVGAGLRSNIIDQIRDDIDRELNNAQAGGWLTRLEDEDERVESIKKGLDLCIAESEELDGLLTLYGVELGTLSEDIAYIEAQSQGLQVQTANQKLLQIELKSLLETISISTSQLLSLREAPLESLKGLEQAESALVLLFKAMVTIDPTLRLSVPRASEDSSMRYGKNGSIGNGEIGSMRALQEKKDIYRNESLTFLRRLKPFLKVKFGAAMDETKKALERGNEGSLTRRTPKTKPDSKSHDLARNMLWRYSPLMLFSREVDNTEWEEMMKTYENICKPVYQEEFRIAVLAWKKNARKPTGDEGDILFTSQVEKPAEGLASTTARKLTVKRSGTLGKVLRAPIGDNSNKPNVDRVQEGRLYQYEVFNGIIEELFPLIIMEQNFYVDFFHVSSLELQDFPDAVAASPPEARRGGDLRKPKPMDPNRDLAKRVTQSMDEVYSFFTGEIQSLVEWALQVDPLQGVGVIAVLERKLLEVEETSQEYLARTLQKAHSRLAGLFTKFLDEQIRAIEDTKVKINKRKGVIAFMRIFPSFSTALETMLATAEGLDVRETVNNAYARLNKTMFESLKVIARENPGAATNAGAAMGDPEDKEALNYQILLIENMNHYVEEVDTKDNPVLEEWKEKAAKEFEEHLSLYLGAVIRRPLGKLLDFLDSTESNLASLPTGTPASSIAERASHSKTTFKRLLSAYDSKETRRGIETLKKRVEKHFGDADDPNISRGLVQKVLDACEGYYENVEKRVQSISADIYDGDATVEWTRGDVISSFKK